MGKMFRSDPLMELQSAAMKKKITPGLLCFMNICGLSYSISVTLLIFLTTLFIILPVVCEDKSEYWAEVYILLFMLFNIAINLLLVSTRKSFYQRGNIHCLPNSSWSDCPDCGTVPPRTHHCPLCKHCILRRDHHCFFTASCVGFENQRYFIVFCFYCGLGCSYCFYLLCQYMTINYDGNNTYSVLRYLLPVAVIELILGYMDFTEFICILSGWLCTVSALVSFSIFIWQLFLASMGITSYEYDKGRWSSHCNIAYNLRSVFGRWWLLNFIIPLPCLKQPGDGTDCVASKYV